MRYPNLLVRAVHGIPSVQDVHDVRSVATRAVEVVARPVVGAAGSQQRGKWQDREADGTLHFGPPV